MDDTRGPLRLYDTLVRAKRDFEPMDPPRVKIYACGPTVYDLPHIGNYRSFVWVDVLHRVLRWAGCEVELVMNITDVDDKTIAGARAAGESLSDFTGRFADAFLDGLATLRVLPAHHYPRATDHIDEMLDLVQQLVQSGHAYEAAGSVWFRVASFAEYGRLARLDPDQMQATERMAGDEHGKEDPRDFALWKAAREGEPSWPSPFGSGRPGWHLECSAMSMRYLGATFDIHTGGADLMFPHHENEIAQSEAATGQPFARTWLHCSHLVVDGSKMSKSLGNFFTLVDVLERGHDPRAIRYLLLSVHYRRQLNFTFEALEQAAAAVNRLQDLVLRLEQVAPELASDRPDPQLRAALAEARSGGAACLLDDLNTAGALGHVFTAVRELNTALDGDRLDGETCAAALAWLRDLDAIWAILPDAMQEIEIPLPSGAAGKAVGPPLGEELESRILERAKARAAKDWAASDSLRDELREAGVELEDTPQGVRWKRIPPLG